jgi:hypothetical protein
LIFDSPIHLKFEFIFRNISWAEALQKPIYFMQ